MHLTNFHPLSSYKIKSCDNNNNVKKEKYSAYSFFSGYKIVYYNDTINIRLIKIILTIVFFVQ